MFMAALAAALAQPALAAETTQADALGNCLVLSTTGRDRITAARWMLGALGSAPQVADVTSIGAEKKEELDRQMAELFTRLIAVDCRQFAEPLVRNGDASAIEEGFSALGKIATNELFSNEAAYEALMGFTKYMDEDLFAAPTE